LFSSAVGIASEDRHNDVGAGTNVCNCARCVSTALDSMLDDGDDEGRINFSVALSPKTTRTRNNKLKQ